MPGDGANMLQVCLRHLGGEKYALAYMKQGRTGSTAMENSERRNQNVQRCGRARLNTSHRPETSPATTFCGNPEDTPFTLEIKQVLGEKLWVAGRRCCYRMGSLIVMGTMGS